jgi:hypothetical protein
MIYCFSTDSAYYPTDPISIDPFDLYWDSETGQVLGLLWRHEKPRGLHPDRGTVTKEDGVRFVFELMMHDYDNFPMPFPLRGRMSYDHPTESHGANLAAIEEGSGTAWLAAEGAITEVDAVPAEALPPS